MKTSYSAQTPKGSGETGDAWRRLATYRAHNHVTGYQQGRALGWMTASMRAPTWGAEAIAVAGADHVGIQVMQQAVGANTLGARMEQPAQIPQDALGKASEPMWWHTIQEAFGAGGENVGNSGPARPKKGC